MVDDKHYQMMKEALKKEEMKHGSGRCEIYEENDVAVTDNDEKVYGSQPEAQTTRVESADKNVSTDE